MYVKTQVNIIKTGKCSWRWCHSTAWQKIVRSEEIINSPIYNTLYLCTSIVTHSSTRMWANAQPDGLPAEHRWRPLFNAAKFGWRPLLECRAVTLPKRESRWNLQGCPKLANRSQPLVGQSSPYYQDMQRRYCCLASFFFPDCRYMPQLRRYCPTKLYDGAQMAHFLGSAFPASHVQHISNMHSKFALRPHHVRKYGRHPISNCWD